MPEVAQHWVKVALNNLKGLVPTRAQECYYLTKTDSLGIGSRSKACESPNLHVRVYTCSEKLGTLILRLTDAGDMEPTSEQGQERVGWSQV